MGVVAAIWRKAARALAAPHAWLNAHVLGALLLPSLLFGIVAWGDRVVVLDQAEQMLQNRVRVLARNTDTTFDGFVRIASDVNAHVKGMGWREISSSTSVHQYLTDLIRNQPGIEALWLVDAQGRVRNSSVEYPATFESQAARTYFISTPQRSTGLFVGSTNFDRDNGEDAFDIALRRTGADGSFEGTAVVTIRPSALTSLWDTVAFDGGSGLLIRRDGRVLATTSSHHIASQMQFEPEFLNAMHRGDTAGRHPVPLLGMGTGALTAYHRVGTYDVYVGRAISLNDALAPWRRHLIFYGVFFFATTAALVALALVSSRRNVLLHETVAALRREIDHRESVEARFWEAQKMEALGRLAGESAHEFGNILNVISGSLSTLEVRPNATASLDLARSATQRGNSMIGTLLSFARRKIPHRELVDVSTAIGGMEGLLHQAIGPSVELQIAGNGQCWAILDRDQLEQAVPNLAVNARDAMPDGGGLLVETTVAELAGDDQGSIGRFVVVTAEDNGCGMPPEVLAHILEPFYTTKGPGKGTGLGLSMVEGFCKQAGGLIRAQSTVGAGTSISMYLPAASPPPPPTSAIKVGATKIA